MIVVKIVAYASHVVQPELSLFSAVIRPPLTGKVLRLKSVTSRRHLSPLPV